MIHDASHSLFPEASTQRNDHNGQGHFFFCNVLNSVICTFGVGGGE